MTPGEAAYEALEALVDRETRATDWTTPAAIRELAQTLHPGRGANRALAGALGVTIRTVQRWTTETAGQRRRPNPREGRELNRRGAVLDRAHARMRVRASMRTGGVVIDFAGTVCTYAGSGCRHRDRSGLRPPAARPPGQTMGPLLAAWAAGDEDALGAAIERTIFTYWRGNDFAGSFGRDEWNIAALDSLTIGLP